MLLPSVRLCLLRTPAGVDAFSSWLRRPLSQLRVGMSAQRYITFTGWTEVLQRHRNSFIKTNGHPSAKVSFTYPQPSTQCRRGYLLRIFSEPPV